MIELNNTKRYLIWGTHLEALRVKYALLKQDIEIGGFVDNYIVEKTLGDNFVYKPIDVVDTSCFLLL